VSFFGNLFRKKPDPARTAAPSTDPANDPNMIRVYDGYGRELFISREDWRTNVLPGSIKEAWNKPDRLYDIIVGALNDGLREDVVAAAKHLYKIDSNASRTACLWGVVLMEEGRLAEAEDVFRGYLSQHGDDGYILSNLAKVYFRKKEAAKAEETLWHALEVDPNQQNGLQWYEAIHRERDGEAAGQDALRRIAALPTSWRAQLWLARSALQSRYLDVALAHYRESFARAGNPVPTNLLMQVSGDLGNAGHLPELLALTEPHFDPTAHGIAVGNNLIKAHLDLGQIEAAARILDQLYALKRPDYQQTLSFWDTELAKARLEPAPAAPARLEMTLLTIDGAIWLTDESPAAELFPAKTKDAPLISFLGSSAEQATNAKKIEAQLAETSGRISRALPLLLAERVEFLSTARARTLVPLIKGRPGGFVLSGVAWSNEDAADYARRGDAPSDYVVVTHSMTQSEPHRIVLRLVRTIDARCVAQLGTNLLPAEPKRAVDDLSTELLSQLGSENIATRAPRPELYDPPDGTELWFYLIRLEQLLAVRTATTVDTEFLSGERDIIGGNIQLCLASSKSVVARILLAQTLATMKRVRPEIIVEFREKIALLQKENPLDSMPHAIVQRILSAAFG
jgi:tetratricopeptide (TPR) repeat protein